MGQENRKVNKYHECHVRHVLTLPCKRLQFLVSCFIEKLQQSEKMQDCRSGFECRCLWCWTALMSPHRDPSKFPDWSLISGLACWIWSRRPSIKFCGYISVLKCSLFWQYISVFIPLPLCCTDFFFLYLILIHYFIYFNAVAPINVIFFLQSYFSF